MPEIPQFSGKDPYDKGDAAPDSDAEALTNADLDAFAKQLYDTPKAPDQIDLDGSEGDNAIQKHLLGEQATKAVEYDVVIEDLLKDIEEKGK